MNNDEIIEKNNGRRFDVCLMNPPYSNTNYGDSLYVDFLIKTIEISNKLVSVNPDSAMLGHSSGGFSKKAKYEKIRKYMDEFKPEIEFVENVFDAGLKSGVIVCLFDKTKDNEKIKITKNGDTLEFDNQSEIKVYKTDYLREYAHKLVDYMDGRQSVFDHLYTTPGFGDGVKEFQNVRIRDINNINKDKLYVFLYKPNASYSSFIFKSINKDNRGVEFNEDFFMKSACVVEFDKDEKEKSKNFCDFLNTDFCALVFKISGQEFHYYKRYHYIPWLDFSKEWTDEELFEMIGMEYNKEEIDKILNDQ